MLNAIRHLRHFGPRFAGLRRFRFVQGLLLLGLALTGAAQVAAADTPWTLANRYGPTTIPGLTMRLVSDTLLVLDSNKPATDGPDAGFHAVRIVNTGGTTVEGVRARLDLAGAGFALAGSPTVQRASQYVGRLAPNDSVTVFWYFGWPRTIGASGTATITLTDNSMASMSRTDNLVVYSSISSGTGGQIFSVGISSSDAIGALISTEVTYEYGNTQVGDHFQLQPAGNRDFNAGCFQLVGSEVLASTVTALQVGLRNTLYTEATVVQSGANKRATVKYTYRSLCVGQATFADPYASQTSGATNYKYSANFGVRYSTNPYFPPGTNLFTIAKSAPDTTARSNDPVRFDVRINNPYAIAVVVDSVVDVMPAGAIFDSVDATSDVTVARSSANPLPGDSGRIVFVGEPDVSYAIPANGSIWLRYWVRLTGPLGTYTNTASAYTNQIRLGDMFASATVRTVPADLSVSKVLLAPSRPMARDTLVYSILTRNATALNLPVTLSDSLPEGTTLLSASHGGSAAGRVVSWPAFTLGADTDRVDTVRVYAPDAGTVTNVARIGTVAGDDDSTSNRSAVTTTLVPAESDLAVTKARVGPASPLAGDTLVYTITASNAGPKVANGVQVTDSIPAGLVYLSASGAPTVSGQRVTWGPLTLGVGETRTDTLRVVAPLEGTYANVARVTGVEVDPDTTNNRFVEDPGTVVGPRANLAIAKTRVGTGPVAIGDAVTYLLTVTNNGPSVATGIALVDSLPSGLTYSAASRTPTVSGRRVEWAAFSLASGASRTDTLVVIGAVGGSYGNIARVSGAEPDPDLSDNRVVHGPAVDVLAVDVAVSKVRVGSGEATVGQVLTWTLTVQNLGLVTASGVMLYDSLPAGYEYVSATGSPAVSGRVVTWGPLTLAAGVSQGYTIEARALLAGVWSNVLVGTSTQPDGNTANNRATDAPPITVNPASGLTVSKARTTDGPFYVGDAITYTVSVQNGGPDGATNVILVDSLPAGFTFQSATGSPTVSGRRIVWPAFDLAADAIATRSITVIGSTPGTWSNVALVGADQVDSDLTDNRFEENPGTTVLAEADLSIVKTRLTAGPFLVGDTIAYKIVTTNGGPSAATGVTVVDTLPSGFTYRGATGSPTVSGQEVRWTFALGAGLTRTDTVVVNTVDAGTFANAASVSGDQADRDPSDNRSTESPSTVVSPSTDLSITKVRLGAGPFYVGDTLSYVITSLNGGPSPATGVTVTDTLPTGFTYLSATNAPTVTGQVVVWGSFTLASGVSRTDTLRIVVSAAGSYTNAAWIDGNETDPDPTDNRGAETPGTTVALLTNLVSQTTVVGPPAPRVGDQIILVIRTRNEGPSNASGVVVIDSLPAGVTLVRATGGPAVSGRRLEWGPLLLDSAAVRIDTIVVTADAEGSRTNISRAVGTEAERSLADNRGSASFFVGEVSADLAVTKRRLTPDPLYQGDEALYEISVRNAGPAGEVTGVTMVDSLPSGMAYVSATGSPVVNGQAITWGPFTLANGAERTETVRVRFLAPGTYANLAVTGGDLPDPDTTNNRVTDPNPPTVLPRANLAIRKQVVGRDIVAVGEPVTFTITTINRGPSRATGVTVVDSLPQGMALLRATGTPAVEGSVLTWGPVTLDSGVTRVDTVVVAITAEGRLVNVARANANESDVSDDDNRSGAVVVAEEARADLSLTKVRLRPAAPVVGDTLVYVLTTRNAGPSPATAVVVVDSLPSGMRFVSATRGASAAGQVVTWPATTLPRDGVLVDTVRAIVERAGEFRNQAVVRGAESDPNEGDNRAVEENPTAPLADMRVTKALVRPLQPVVGDTMLFVLTITNAGPSPVVAARLSDSLPASLRLVRTSGTPLVQGRLVQWGPMDLMSGASRTDSVWVAATEVGRVTNVALASAGDGPNGPIADPDPSSNRAVVEVTIGDTPRLFLSKRASGDAQRGAALAFDLLLRNDGPGLISDSLFLVDTLPQALVYQGASAPGWAVQYADGIFSARRAGPLAERDSLRIRLFTRVADNAPAQFENTAHAGVIPDGADAAVRASAGRGIRPVRATTGVITLVTVDPAAIDLEITADRAEAEVLETVNYSARLVAVRAVPDPTLRLGITLPSGFTLTPGTVRVVGADPSRIQTTNTSIQLPLSGLLAGTPVVVAYQARPGVEALRSRGITNGVLSNPESPEIVRDSVRTLVRAAMGEDEATIVGQVTMACTNDRSGVPGIRLVLQDGREVRTDADGRYSFPGIAARPHVLRVDEASLPAGVRLVLPRQAVAGREGGAAVLVRPMYGELVAADFTLEAVDGGSCAAAVSAAGGAAVAADSSARRPGLLLSAMVQARAETFDRADSLGRVDADVLDLNIKELATWNADSTRRGAVRGALYLEGSMGEGRNVTLRVDTERPHLDRFFNDLRPDELYPLLGDAAASAARAQARGRVFGEVNYDGATARFGDFLVPMPEGGTVQLGRYPRVLSGAMASTQGAKGMATGWASRTTSRFMVDEFRADESTGLLQLRRANAVLWSETVELVTFDRAHPGVVLTTERLQRFVDYSVEPGTGRLVLRRLVPGYDEAMNPIVIRVAYEVDGEGEHGWVYGGSGELRFGESARAGVLVVRDDDPLQRFQMASVGGSVTLTPGVTLGAELAASDLDGVSGVAGRVDLQVATGSFRLSGRYQDVGADFRNPAAGILPDRREAALLGTYQLDALTSVGGEYYRSALRSGRDAREGGQVWVARKFGEKADLELGLRRILAGGVAGDSSNAAAANTDGTAARFRVRYALDAARDAAVTGEVEAGLSEGMPSRGALGFGMRIFDKTRLFLGQEINTGTGGGYDIASASRRDQTVIGFQSEYRPGQQVFSEYRIGRGIDGRTAASVVGLRNTWKLNEQLAFTGLAERQATATGTGYAIGGGAEFRRPDATDASVRAEYRMTPAGADNVFATAGVIHRVSPWASLLAQTSVGWQPEADLVSARSRAGMVFRRGESTSMLVARYEHHFERSQGALAGERLERTVHLLSAHGTVPMGTAMRFRGQLATKFVEDAVGGSAVDAQATLLGVRVTRDLGRRWDASLAARLLGDGRLSNGLTSYGLEAGYEVVNGVRAAAGYNVRGFKDRDLAPGATTQRGFYLDLILTATEALLGSRP